MITMACSIPISEQKRTKREHIKEAVVGSIVAFKIGETKALSGKVMEIKKDVYIIQTKNGINFSVKLQGIIWVKTSTTWPYKIYSLLKGIKPNENK